MTSSARSYTAKPDKAHGTLVTHSWRRDVLKAAALQAEPAYRDPLLLMDVFVEDRLDGYWQISCGYPPLIFHPRYMAVGKVALGDLKLISYRMRQCAAPSKMDRLLWEARLASTVVEVFIHLQILNADIEQSAIS